jgi:hypothetical protein
VDTSGVLAVSQDADAVVCASITRHARQSIHAVAPNAGLSASVRGKAAVGDD